MSHFSVGNYLSHNAENFRKEPFEVSEKLEYRKILCIMGWYHDFPSKVFSFTVPRNFVGEPFCCVSENFLYGSIDEKEGGIMIFCRDFSVSHNEKLRGGTLCVHKIFGMVNNFQEEGNVTFFRRKLFTSQCQK